MAVSELSTALTAPFWSRRGLTLVGFGLALTCSACAAPLSMKPLPPPSTSGPMVSRTSVDASVGMMRLGRTTPTSDQGIQLVADWQPDAEGIPVGGAMPLRSGACPPEAIVSCPPDPRMPCPGAAPFAVGMPLCDQMCQPSPHYYPDEYLCDGGDREWPVHYHENERHGLDTEDTVIEFIDARNQSRIAKSNKVCVYSPRFASVRTVSRPYEDGSIQEAIAGEHAHQGGEVRTRLAPNLGNKNVAVGKMRMRSRASGLEGEVVQTDLWQRQSLRQHEKVLNTFQSIRFFETGLLDQSDVARLNQGIRAALLWSREQNPVIQGKIETANIGVSEIHASALTVVDDQANDQPPHLRIVKVADKKDAVPGDVITFLLRYDNLGPSTVTAVRVVDNLTPRLEYVDDSGTSDRPGTLVVQDNGEGSLVLIWELSDPLPAKTGGTVTFQARVR